MNPSSQNCKTALLNAVAVELHAKVSDVNVYDRRGEALLLEAQTELLRTAGVYAVPNCSATVAEASITTLAKKLVGTAPRGKIFALVWQGAAVVHGVVLVHGPPGVPVVTKLYLMIGLKLEQEKRQPGA